MAARNHDRSEARWGALDERRASADGLFVYGVRTTGIFCRPSCASRRPSRANVEFFDHARDAARAGYRPCKRCRPAGVDPRAERTRAIVRACRILERDDGPRGNADVARALGLSAAYFQRLFKRELGITPQAYRRRVKAERAKEALAGAGSVVEAAFAGGYGGAARFYDGAGRELGMPPRAARRGAEGREVTYATLGSALGRVLVAWTPRGVCHVALGDSDEELTRELAERFPAAALARGAQPPWVAEVVAVVEVRGARPTVPLDVRGTAFQERVWRALRDIPAGSTRSYADVARAIGAPASARAVARACAANPVAVLVPCHRVIREGGEPGGYRWGPERKRALLAREAKPGPGRGARVTPARS